MCRKNLCKNDIRFGVKNVDYAFRMKNDAYITFILSGKEKIFRIVLEIIINNILTKKKL